MIGQLRTAAGRLRAELDTLVIARRDPRVLRLAWVVVVTVAYSLSPIDLIPDFASALGLLDDLLLVPFGLWLALRLIPDK